MLTVDSRYDRAHHDSLSDHLRAAVHQRHQAPRQSGGVHAVHANNANSWRRSFAAAHDLIEFLDTEVYGGFKDDINDGFVAFGISPFAGSSILTPINLYAPRNPGVGVGFAPMGRPAGVRMVNMRDLNPGSQIVVGAVNWRVFPAFSKNASVNPGNPTAGNYPTFESSHYVGYAYPES